MVLAPAYNVYQLTLHTGLAKRWPVNWTGLGAPARTAVDGYLTEVPKIVTLTSKVCLPPQQNILYVLYPPRGAHEFHTPDDCGCPTQYYFLTQPLSTTDVL